MTVSPITSDYGIFAANNASSTSSTSGTSSTTGSGSDDSQMFLQLMVAQMKYQDPMNPTDSSQMLTQNAIFTEVQAVQEMQSEMGMVLSSQLAFGSASMVGKNVSWVDANGAVQSGAVDSVDFSPSGPVVNVGGQQVALNSIGSVGGDATASSTPSTATGTTTSTTPTTTTSGAASGSSSSNA